MADEQSVATKRLYVGNLPWNVNEESLQAAFAEWGASGATIPMNDQGRSKGFGFVDVAADKAEAAIEAMNGNESMGRPLTVNEARPREERPAPQA
jgi:RNA recognition motif-containing protein